jgi:hypothetical protein
MGVVFGSLAPATAAPLVTSELSSQSTEATLVEEIGWRRQYRRYGYPVPYAYYPPAYGYYAPRLLEPGEGGPGGAVGAG